MPTRAKCATASFAVTWIRKVSTIRPVPSRIRADPPPLTTGLLWHTREHDLIDPYRVAPELFGSDAVPSFDSPEWLRLCSARDRKCSLCPGVEASRLVPCCACENWVHLECSYGIPEGRLCAAHCQIIDSLKGVVVTDFNCPKPKGSFTLNFKIGLFLPYLGGQFLFLEGMGIEVLGIRRCRSQ